MDYEIQSLCSEISDIVCSLPYITNSVSAQARKTGIEAEVQYGMLDAQCNKQGHKRA